MVELQGFQKFCQGVIGNCLYFFETFATSPHLYHFTDPMQSIPLNYHVSLKKSTNGKATIYILSKPLLHIQETVYILLKALLHLHISINLQSPYSPAP